MMCEDLHSVVGCGQHPESKPGHHDDRWMVISLLALCAYPRAAS